MGHRGRGPHGVLEDRDGILLTDDVLPHRHGSTTPMASSRLITRSWRRFGRVGAGDDEIALRVSRRHREEVLSDRLVEGVRLRLEAVMGAAAAPSPLVGRDVDDDGEVGDEVSHRPHLEVVHLRRAEVATGALVGDGGVGVAVGDHHLAPVEGGPDELVDVVRLVGGEEQGLGPGADVVTVEHEVADGPTELGAPRLAGHRDGAAPLAQGVRQEPHLCRLARRRRPLRRR